MTMASGDNSQKSGDNSRKFKRTKKRNLQFGQQLTGGGPIFAIFMANHHFLPFFEKHVKKQGKTGKICKSGHPVQNLSTHNK